MRLSLIAWVMLLRARTTGRLPGPTRCLQAPPAPPRLQGEAGYALEFGVFPAYQLYVVERQSLVARAFPSWRFVRNFFPGSGPSGVPGAKLPLDQHRPGREVLTVGDCFDQPL